MVDDMSNNTGLLAVGSTAELERGGEPVPCGDAETHWHWRDLGWSCPACAAKSARERKERDENRMAEKIAAAVVRQMAERSNA